MVSCADGYEVLMPLAPWEKPSVLAQALASLEHQTLLPTRVVISCDGPPTPELWQVLNTTQLPLLVIEGPGSEGVGPVLARGMKHCQSDLIVRADADDISCPDRCCAQVQAMMRRPELAALSSWMDEFENDPSAFVSIRKVPIGAENIKKFSKWRNPINHPAAILRRSKVMAVGGYVSRPGFEDYYLWLRLLKHGFQLDNLPEPLVKARVGVKHTARRNGWKYLQSEACFLYVCAQEGLLHWGNAMCLAILRLPIRLMPVGCQKFIMRKALRATPQT